MDRSSPRQPPAVDVAHGTEPFARSRSRPPVLLVTEPGPGGDRVHWTALAISHTSSDWTVQVHNPASGYVPAGGGHRQPQRHLDRDRLQGLRHLITRANSGQGKTTPG